LEVRVWINAGKLNKPDTGIDIHPVPCLFGGKHTHRDIGLFHK
jgi:hypothetical protein